MVEPVSCNELYEKFHELYITVIRHIISSIMITKADGTSIDAEMLHRVQEYCLTAFDELNSCRYQRMLGLSDTELSPLAGLTYSISSIADSELLPVIKEKYKDMLTEEEFNMLGELFDKVSEQLSGFLSLSCKFLRITNDIDL